ncbi:MAG TPA: metal ABC transporter permease, partial [Candidatus Limnocylindrales bacterium]|nr:metal ABC transporter permease [Candidatus Limnocylindrales bacterium]
IVAIVFARKQQLILALFSRELAAASNVKLQRLDLEFLLLFSLTILVSLKFLGALLAGALLMIPAATGRRLAAGINSLLAWSVLASAFSVIAGLLISSFAFSGLNAGPIVVLVAAFLFALVSLLFLRSPELRP